MAQSNHSPQKEEHLNTIVETRTIHVGDDGTIAATTTNASLNVHTIDSGVSNMLLDDKNHVDISNGKSHLLDAGSRMEEGLHTFRKFSVPFIEGIKFSAEDDEDCNFTLIGKEYKYSLFDAKDHSDMYERYRPRYPPALYDKMIMPRLAGFASKVVVDVACGPGNATFDLAKRCDFVIGADISQAQIERATGILEEHKDEFPNLLFDCACAENLTDLVRKHRSTLAQFQDDNTHSKDEENLEVFDLITVACSLHWFDFEKFFDQADKVLKKGGYLVAWTYFLNTFSNENAQKIITDFYNSDDLKSSWTPRKTFIDHKYRNIPNVPYEENMEFVTFTYSTQISMGDYIGFLKTLSVVQKYGELFGTDKKDELMSGLLAKLSEALDVHCEQDMMEFNLPFVFLVTRKHV